MKRKISILKNLKHFLKSNTVNCLWAVLSLIYLQFYTPSDCVVFLNVGQGDSTLIQQGNFQILIDAGYDIQVTYQISKYMKFKDRVIDIVILTHPHDDHLAGILDLLDRYEIGELWLYPVCYNNPNYKLLLSRNIKIREVNAGMSFNIGEIYLQIIWPRAGKQVGCNTGKYLSWNGNINNDSLVIFVRYLNRNILLMGDAEKEVESELNIQTHVDYLKAGHHCSKTSNSETFLKMITPRYAICSCGESNKYGHPDSGTLKTFSSLDVQYYLTYSEGSILLR